MQRVTSPHVTADWLLRRVFAQPGWPLSAHLQPSGIYSPHDCTTMRSRACDQLIDACLVVAGLEPGSGRAGGVQIDQQGCYLVRI